MASDSIWLLNPSGQRASGEWIDDTLRARAEEKGMLARLDLAGRFPRQRVEVLRGGDLEAEANRLFYRRGWTDGLPITAPTTGRVSAMLRFSPAAPKAVLGEVDPLKGQATVEKVAVNAVMAGCRPEYFPVVLAAVEAALDPAFNMRGVQTTDENVAPLLILNGPLASTLQVNAGFGALGPGWQANATIGRALRLAMHNLGGGWPEAVSFAGLGQPARYTLCLAENERQSPWPPLHVELGHPAEASTVTLMRAETAINVTGGLEEIASVMGSAASAFSMIYGGKVAVIVAPATAAALAREGVSKDDVKRWLHARGRIAAEVLPRLWAGRPSVRGEARWPDWVRRAMAEGSVPPVETPEDIVVIVAGGDVPIAQQAYFPTWGFPACRITREVRLPPDWAALVEGARAEP